MITAHQLKKKLYSIKSIIIQLYLNQAIPIGATTPYTVVIHIDNIIHININKKPIVSKFKKQTTFFLLQ